MFRVLRDLVQEEADDVDVAGLGGEVERRVSLVVRQDGTGWLHGKALWENGQNELILKPFHFQLCWDCSASKLKLLFLVASAITMPKASQC